MHINQNTIRSLINNSIQIVQFHEFHRLRVELEAGARGLWWAQVASASREKKGLIRNPIITGLAHTFKHLL